MDPKIAQNLLFLLTRGTKPIYLTAGKIFPMTMTTFCSVLKTSTGYISFLMTKHDLYALSLSLSLPHSLSLFSYSFSLAMYTYPFLLSIINMMAEDWIAFKQDRERNVMIKRARMARLIMMIGYVIVVIAFLTVTILPCFGIPVIDIANLTGLRKPLPLKTYHFYNTDKSPQFELTFFIHSLTFLLASILHMCVDIFLVLMVLHVCGQLENLKYRLINLISYKNFNNVLSNIVRTHLRLIRFADNIENTYSLMMLVLIIHFGIVFSLSGFLFTILYIYFFCFSYIKIYLDFMWAVQLHRIGFEMVGLWPNSNKRIKKNLSEIWASIIFILLIFVANIPMICAVVQVWGNMVSVIKNLQIALPLLIISIKYVIIRQKQRVLLSIINMMAEDWIAFKQDRERNVMIKRARTARLIMMIGYTIMIIGMLVAIILPCFGIPVVDTRNLTGKRKPLPLKTYHFYNTDKSPQFELTFFIHSLTTFLAGFIYTCVDIFLVLIVLHVCGQLENLKYRLINLMSYENFNNDLCNIVRTHLRLIRFAEYIENTYSLMMLVLVIHFGIVFCISGFLFIIIFTDRNIDKSIIVQGCLSILSIIILLMNTLLYCITGELIMDQVSYTYNAYTK
ncbi:hypothetical protein ALC62_01814 [Cyphomyrmex costatus]|uniref:Odorant receptor 13a n=1 Tax=Cyphomyrmex costatus TaxID=456900 RepID=A0A151IP21_9HYME|nr:hypothetical protein ALC62_01814 [Cyphomyrmex costatus]